MRSNKTVSCGCFKTEATGNRVRTHGLSKSSTYNTWRSMIERCYSVKNSHYKSYGEKGITVCDSWKNSFESFLSDMGLRPEGCTIDRLNNDKGYYKENCKWSTSKEQSRNTSRSVKITYRGETKNVSDWSTELGLSPKTLTHRLKKLSMEEAMNKTKYYKNDK